MPECRFLVAPDEYAAGPHMGALKAEPAPRMLCTWAIYHPASAEKLTETPPWLAKNAVAGHLWREGDCDRCPAFERGPAVEGCV